MSGCGSVESGRAEKIHAVRRPSEIHTHNAVGRPEHKGTDRDSPRNDDEVKEIIIAWEAVDLHGCTGLESEFPEPSEGLGVA